MDSCLGHYSGSMSRTAALVFVDPTLLSIVAAAIVSLLETFEHGTSWAGTADLVTDLDFTLAEASLNDGFEDTEGWV
jgi:hypothetical protein